MSLEKLVQIVQETYAFYERLEVSPGFLIGVAALFAVAGLLALREAAAWFFKVEDIKRDIARLQETAQQLEAEIRIAQNLIQKKMTGAGFPKTLEDSHQAPFEETPNLARIPAVAIAAAPAKTNVPAFRLSRESTEPEITQDNAPAGPSRLKQKEEADGKAAGSFPISH
jgi:hypothetical protein